MTLNTESYETYIRRTAADQIRRPREWPAEQRQWAQQLYDALNADCDGEPLEWRVLDQLSDALDSFLARTVDAKK